MSVNMHTIPQAPVPAKIETIRKKINELLFWIFENRILSWALTYDWELGNSVDQKTAEEVTPGV